MRHRGGRQPLLQCLRHCCGLETSHPPFPLFDLHAGQHNERHHADATEGANNAPKRDCGVDVLAGDPHVHPEEGGDQREWHHHCCKQAELLHHSVRPVGQLRGLNADAGQIIAVRLSEDLITRVQALAAPRNVVNDVTHVELDLRRDEMPCQSGDQAHQQPLLGEGTLLQIVDPRPGQRDAAQYVRLLLGRGDEHQLVHLLRLGDQHVRRVGHHVHIHIQDAVQNIRGDRHWPLRYVLFMGDSRASLQWRGAHRRQ
mmetsp:Transcript_81620/g.143937  ORF Transcript_81620/g.143937 Transcript_81620/m.143937 type:complete len:256 (-) Transcript_81620:531-1298(-)